MSFWAEEIKPFSSFERELLIGEKENTLTVHLLVLPFFHLLKAANVMLLHVTVVQSLHCLFRPPLQ